MQRFGRRLSLYVNTAAEAIRACRCRCRDSAVR
ncbi:hypothetical protein H6S22_11780 [Escherichia coli]|nr:hypothetical protein H6S22_11780 [Escherichia coli]